MSIDQSNYSVVAVGILDQCRTFIRRCLRSVEQGGTTASSSSNSSINIRLAIFLLDFMLEINSMFSSNLTKSDLEVLFSWCQGLASVKSNSKRIDNTVPCFLTALFANSITFSFLFFSFLSRVCRRFDIGQVVDEIFHICHVAQE